ncbi:hypothetical protein F4778DRAFT_765393 [Xylariomycetidae sp. FL2044]|nr:hypothetical protein F4778DRAFT_765393 [Xylariomycetidae sp. FL2044]
MSSNSVASQLAKSTHGLAIDFISKPANAGLMSEIMPLSKAGSSRTRQSAGMNASEASLLPGSQSSGSAHEDTTFKSVQSSNQTAPEESEYLAFLDGTDVLKHTTYGKVCTSGYIPSPTTPSIEGMGHPCDDGAEAVRLLESGYDKVAVGDRDILPPSFAARSTLRHVLLEKRATTSDEPALSHWAQTLNFVPDFLLGGNGSTETADIIRHLGVADEKEASQIWFGQWQDVLSSYTDEVWGDLSPLAGKARQELEALDGSRPVQTSELKALRRLRQILLHVRES